MRAERVYLVFSLSILEERPGKVVLRISGKGAKKYFNQEAGTHIWRRVSPTEKRGRVHTSAITVALLADQYIGRLEIKEEDLRWQATRGSGAGGQHRNKTDSAVQLWHKPSGIMVRSEQHKHQWQNRQEAQEILRAKLEERAAITFRQERNQKRVGQIGGGARSDKRRTVNLQEGIVIDHDSGWTMDAKKYFKGNW